MKTHKQTEQSAYVSFSFAENFFKSFFSKYATNSPFVSGLSTKGNNRAELTSFHGEKGGEKS